MTEFLRTSGKEGRRRQNFREKPGNFGGVETMGKATELREVRIAELIPYERNAKRHSRDQLEKLERCIRDLGFLSPCLIDKDMNVIAGHGRIQAAKAAGLEKVPCVFVEGLTEEERRRYIIEDNRISEFGDWDMDTLAEELRDLADHGVEIRDLNFDVDISGFEEAEIQFGDADPDEGEKEKGTKWTTRGVRCDMTPQIASREKNGHRYISLFASSKEGMTLEEIKNSRKCEKQVAEAVTEFLRQFLGENMRGTGWAIITTGRRRHRNGYHFATAVCKAIAEKTGLRFYESAIECGNADRLKPALTITTEPEEKNLVLFDDIITTGTTMSRTAELLQNAGYTVLTVIGIRNQ